MPNYDDIEDQRRSYDAMNAKATKLERENRLLMGKIRRLKAQNDELAQSNILHQVVDGMPDQGLKPPSDKTTMFVVLDDRNHRRVDSIWLWEHRAVQRMRQLTNRYARLDVNAVCIEIDRVDFSALQLLAYHAAHKAGVIDGLGRADAGKVDEESTA